MLRRGHAQLTTAEWAARFLEVRRVRDATTAEWRLAVVGGATPKFFGGGLTTYTSVLTIAELVTRFLEVRQVWHATRAERPGPFTQYTPL